MGRKQKAARSIVMRGIAKALNRCGSAIADICDASATGIGMITGAVKGRSRVVARRSDKTGQTSVVENVLVLAGTSLPDIRTRTGERVLECRERLPHATREQIAYKVSSRLIRDSALKTGVWGGLSSSPATLPGIGSLGTLVLFLTADFVKLLRTQIELCYGIAAAYEVDVEEEELQAIALAIIGFSGTAQAAKGISARVAREIIDRAAGRNLQAGLSKTVAVAAPRAGFVMSSRAARIIPFLGIPLGASVNIATTLMVGKQARRYFSTWIAELDISADKDSSDSDREAECQPSMYVSGSESAVDNPHAGSSAPNWIKKVSNLI